MSVEVEHHCKSILDLFIGCCRYVLIFVLDLSVVISALLPPMDVSIWHAFCSSVFNI